MSNIYVGDNGTVLSFTVKDNGKVVDIRGGTVKITLKRGTEKFNKTATITDGEQGKCELLLTSEDLSVEGSYQFQATVTFPNGNNFSSDSHRFTVLPLI